jgi:membrane-associated phospholipid phosphatase
LENPRNRGTIRGGDYSVLQVVSRDASYTAPALWTATRLAIAAIAFALLAAAVLSVDLQVAAFLRAHPLPSELARLVRLSEVFAWGGTVALLILIAAVLDTRGWRILPPLAIGAFGAGLIADGFKLVVARLRPGAADSSGAAETFLAWLPLLQLDALGHPYGRALQSFPSGHAATAVGLAIALAALYPRGRWLFVTLAALACFQRMEAQAHFASDVLSGAAIGCLVGAACQWRCRSIGDRAVAA